jgi:hypothetical protein
MNAAVRGLVLTGIVLGGCHTAHDVAVTSYHVATAPVHFVHRQIDKPAATETTTTTTTTSDVTSPGQPVPPSISASTQRRVGSEGGPLPTATPRVTHKETETAEAKPKPSPSSRAVSTQPEFPTAKPVAGKPGYVYSPSDPGKYVDVSGYAPGSKVKDPYSGKIFLVPKGGD